jgi:hypothetical protein
MEVPETARHAYGGTPVVLRIVRLMRSHTHCAVRVGRDASISGVVAMSFDDLLRRKHPGTDQQTQRKRRCKSAREPADAVRISGTNRAVRRWDGVFLDRLWDGRAGHVGGIGLNRRWTALKFSILCGSKTSVNAIFHPQPPFSISRRQKCTPRRPAGILPGSALAEDCAQPAEPIPSVLSARSRARVHKWLRLMCGRCCLFPVFCATCPNSASKQRRRAISASGHSDRVKASGCAFSGSSSGKREPDSSRLHAATQSVQRVRVRPKTSDSASMDAALAASASI